MKKLRGKDLTRLGGMLGEFFNNLACAVEADQVDIGVVDWLRSDPGKEAVHFAAHRAWFEIVKRYREDQPKTQPKKKIRRQDNPYLRLISGGEGIVIAETDGTETLAQASDVFTGYIDNNLMNWDLNTPDEAKPETLVEVHELVKNGRFDQFFPTLGELNKLCLTQHQIKVFCRTHKKWLRTPGYATFFLFKKNGKFFVASVDFDGRGRLRVGVDHLSRVIVWYARRQLRIVVPCLADRQT